MIAVEALVFVGASAFLLLTLGVVMLVLALTFPR